MWNIMLIKYCTNRIEKKRAYYFLPIYNNYTVICRLHSNKFKHMKIFWDCHLTKIV